MVERPRTRQHVRFWGKGPIHSLVIVGDSKQLGCRRPRVPYPTDENSSRQLLRGITVKRASSGEEIDLLGAWDPAPGKKTIVAFFTHTADFNSW